MNKITNQIVIETANQIGFDLVGFSKVITLEDEYFLLESWLKNNFQAGMFYMAQNNEKRRDVKKIFPEAKSVISLGVNYYKNYNFEIKDSNCGKVSRYAWGKDYHKVIAKMLKKFESTLKSIDNNFKSKSYVDTGPVMDKVWAVRSGLGWMGKHTNIINREIGSWFFIANVFCNIEFEYSKPIVDHCGSCNACIDACPTEAIVVPYVVDSNKCISYQTIENKGDIPVQLKNKFDNWAFGCDICQDVCPWNHKFSKESKIEEFEPQNLYLKAEDFSKMTQEDFNIKFKDSPIKRSKLSGIRRNLSFLFD